MKNKRGISPVIATVLLIAIVIVLAMIIFLWARGFVKETILKEGQNIKYTCEDVSLDTEYSGETLQIVNSGNIPIYQLSVKGVSQGTKETLENEDFNAGLGVGQSASYEVGSYDSLEIHPVLLGETSTSKKSLVCDNSFTANNEG